ncbi:MAG: Haloacid dehalogenase superfamily enzyme, subfamily IA [Parcubacteria group bacterium GW2011_GWA1_38_7]|nr:MAG: Haloacid dehalogenase superfamily enzyme, subfamily IA [Parcubacteria group bacterium GW2011_GWA1_38_7]
MLKFIYFDLGGVVIRDFDGTNNWDLLKKELGIITAKNDKFEKLWKRYDAEINTTRDVNTLIPILNKELDLDIPQEYSLLDGFVSRFTKNKQIWPIIKNARKKYKIGLLTNMYPGMLKTIGDRGILLQDKFDVIVDSSIEKVKKPDSNIYKLSELKCGFKSDEIMFIDNSERNLIEPKKMGWQIFWYDNRNIEKSTKDLKNILL